MHIIKAVLFDLDGTLVETHIDFPAMTQAMRQLVASAGVPKQEIEGRDILGMVYAASTWLDANGRGDGDAFQSTAFAALEELEVQGCSHPDEIDGAASVLSELRRRNIGIGIVTRNCRRVSEILVDRFGLVHDVLLTRDDVPRVKPDPDHLHRALANLSVDAAESIMVGDHWMDIRAGIDAGCRSTVGVLHQRTREFYAPCPPSHYASTLTDLLSWLPEGITNIGGE